MRPMTLTAALLASALVAMPPPQAAAEQTALETIGMLEAQGYTVNIDRIGSAPLEQCTVTGIRNPQQVTRWVNVEDDGWGNHGNNHTGLVEIVVSQSISVSLDCNR
jgi:hypothetical protein